MRTALIAAALVPAAACATPLRPADRAQEVSRNPPTARVAAAGVTVDLTAGDQRNWLGALPPGLMPVEATIRNESGGPIRVRADHFAIALPNGKRQHAIEPGQMWAELRTRVPGLVPGSPPQLPVPGRASDRTALAMIYEWPGLKGAGSFALAESLRPDPRPRPEGILQNGSSASTVLYFDADPNRLKSFTLDVSVEDEGGQVLGSASAPFAR